MPLVEMSSEQGTTHSACDGSQCPSTNSMSDQGTADTTRYRPDRTVAATTAMTIMSAPAVVDVMVPVIGRTLRKRRCRHDGWPGNKCGQGGYR